MSLTSKDRRTLKSRGQTMNDDLRLGKAGVTESFVEHASGLLNQQELIKLRFTDVTGPDRKLLADEVSAALDAECVSVVGRTILIYRANPELEPRKQLLPT